MLLIRETYNGYKKIQSGSTFLRQQANIHKKKLLPAIASVFCMLASYTFSKNQKISLDSVQKLPIKELEPSPDRISEQPIKELRLLNSMVEREEKNAIQNYLIVTLILSIVAYGLFKKLPLPNSTSFLLDLTPLSLSSPPPNLTLPSLAPPTHTTTPTTPPPPPPPTTTPTPTPTSSTSHSDSYTKKMVSNYANNPDENGSTPLHRNILEGNREEVEILIKYGADINLKIKDFTPLHLAVDYPEIFKLLLEKGAKDSVDKRGWTAYAKFISKNPTLTLEDVPTPVIKYSRELCSRAALAHIFELSIKSKIQDLDNEEREVHLEGFYHANYFFKILAEGAQNFSKNCDPLMGNCFFEELYEVCLFTATNPSLEEMFSRWNRDLPIIFHSGWVKKQPEESSHYSSILLTKNLLIFCDRSTPIGYQIFHFKKELQLKHFEKLAKKTRLPEKYKKFFNGIRRFLNSEVDLAPKLNRLKFNRVSIGNCCWANSEGLFLIYFVYLIVKDKNDQKLGSEKLWRDIDFTLYLWHCSLRNLAASNYLRQPEKHKDFKLVRKWLQSQKEAEEEKEQLSSCNQQVLSLRA